MNANIERMLEEVGQTLEIGKEEIKMTLKNKKGPILIAIAIIATAVALGNSDIIFGKRYAAVSPLDFNFPLTLIY